ncbi:oligoribonuclease [Tersicoccus sp. MR15.9]|uniref:oligoribonuclease n=1 Tax=Tersicoccus mangrovi TaxID=3121635 RepID=UPI002FE574E5
MTTPTAADRLLWLDVETTGLDPAGGHRLLQVAAIVTDVPGNQLSDEFERVVHHTAAEKQAAWDITGDFVREMHTKTGLWDRLESGTPLAQIDTELHAFLTEHAPGRRQARIAGNSVRLDANFTDANLPTTAGHLHYRVVDVSTIAFVAEARGWAPGHFEKKTTHNALDDIRESLAEYRWLNGHIEGAMNLLRPAS